MDSLFLSNEELEATDAGVGGDGVSAGAEVEDVGSIHGLFGGESIVCRRVSRLLGGESRKLRGGGDLCVLGPFGLCTHA